MKTPITVTIVTRAMCDAIAATARQITPDLTDYYPRAFERWPMDVRVGEPPIPIDCVTLDRGMGR